MRNFQHASGACLFRLYRPGDMWMEEEEHGPAGPIPFCQRAETSHSSLFPSCVLQPGKHHRRRRRGLFHTYLQAEAGMSWRISLRARFISCVCAITGRENEKKKKERNPPKQASGRPACGQCTCACTRTRSQAASKQKLWWKESE